MTTKAVFLDWVNTLVRMEPDRHVLCAEMCREFGIDVDPERALRGIYSAEEEVPEGRPIHWSSGADPGAFIRYNDIVLRMAGATIPDGDTTMRMWSAPGSVSGTSSSHCWTTSIPHWRS